MNGPSPFRREVQVAVQLWIHVPPCNKIHYSWWYGTHKLHGNHLTTWNCLLGMCTTYIRGKGSFKKQPSKICSIWSSDVCLRIRAYLIFCFLFDLVVNVGCINTHSCCTNIHIICNCEHTTAANPCTKIGCTVPLIAPSVAYLCAKHFN